MKEDLDKMKIFFLIVHFYLKYYFQYQRNAINVYPKYDFTEAVFYSAKLVFEYFILRIINKKRNNLLFSPYVLHDGLMPHHKQNAQNMYKNIRKYNNNLG